MGDEYMNKKKVAIVLHGLGANGIDTLFANLSKQWKLEKFDITYFLAVDEGAKQFWEETVIEHGVKVIHITDLDGKKLFKWPVNLYKYLKQYGPFDAIHVNMDMLNGINLLVAKLAGINKRVCHAHRSSSVNNHILKRCYVTCMKFLIKRTATKCVACSEIAGEYFFGSKYELLYNGIDLNKYQGNGDDLQIRKSAPIFATVGRLNVQKNPLFLLEVFKEVSERKPDARMKWIGAGELLNEVKECAYELRVDDKIEFLGIRNDVNDILKTCHYFLLPSLFEGLSLALAEAQASGLDCFVSDTVSKLSDCEKCKFISLEKSASEWADEICNYIDSEEEMQLNHTQMDKFDISCMARKLEEMYSN